MKNHCISGDAMSVTTAGKYFLKNQLSFYPRLSPLCWAVLLCADLRSVFETRSWKWCVLRSRQDFACSVHLCLKIVGLCFFQWCQRPTWGWGIYLLKYQWTGRISRLSEANSVLEMYWCRYPTAFVHSGTQKCRSRQRQIVHNLLLIFFGALFLSFCQHKITYVKCVALTCSVPCIILLTWGYVRSSTVNEHKGVKPLTDDLQYSSW